MSKEEKNEKKEKDNKDFIVTPWDVCGTIDYKKLIEKFGTQLIDQQLLDKFKKVTGKELHPWLKRGIYFTHRAFDTFWMHMLLENQFSSILVVDLLLRLCILVI
jgi:hypothetical protein